MQWVFKEGFENDFTETAFRYEGNDYFCSKEDIGASIHKSVNFVWSLGSTGGNETANGNLTLLEYISEFEEGYKKQQNLYVNEHNVCTMPVEWARGIHDAVWSLAFAVNRSLNVLNINRTETVPGSKILAQTIANHMSDIDFQGVSGRIDFDNESGFNTDRRVNIYHFEVEKSSTLIGFYTLNNLGDIQKRFTHVHQCHI